MEIRVRYLLTLCTDRATRGNWPGKIILTGYSNMPPYPRNPAFKKSGSTRIGCWFMFVGWIADDHFLEMLRPLRKLELRFLHGAPIHELCSVCIERIRLSN